jgi:hypothetical protein
VQPYEANLTAIGGFAKQIRLALLRLGMRRCSVRLVYRQGEAPIRGQRVDYYSAFWRWFQALWLANRAGAEFLYEDFRARVQALRERDLLQHDDWTATVARAVDEGADSIREAILDRDPQAIRKELVEDIAIKRRLLAMVEARSLGATAGLPGGQRDRFDEGQPVPARSLSSAG